MSLCAQAWLLWGAWVVVCHSPSRGGCTWAHPSATAASCPPPPPFLQGCHSGLEVVLGSLLSALQSERRAQSVVWGGLASDNSGAYIFASLGRADTLCWESDASVQGFPGGASGKESACNAEDIKGVGLIPGLEYPLEEGMATHSRLFLSGESHGQRSLAHDSPWGCRESDTTEVT